MSRAETLGRWIWEAVAVLQALRLRVSARGNIGSGGRSGGEIFQSADDMVLRGSVALCKPEKKDGVHSTPYRLSPLPCPGPLSAFIGGFTFIKGGVHSTPYARRIRI